MQPLDPAKKPRVDEPRAEPRRALGRRPRARASTGCGEQGVRFTPGGIRKGAAGYDVCFIHPKGNDESPLGGEGVLIELVQAPPEVIAAHRA